jgi:hypothetical protein
MPDDRYVRLINDLYDGEPQTSMVWLPMRPTVTCPSCLRRGRVQRRIGVLTIVEHHCPGPFLLAGGENDPILHRATFVVRLFTKPGSRDSLVVGPRPLLR